MDEIPLGIGAHPDGAGVRHQLVTSAAHAPDVILAAWAMDAHAPVDAIERLIDGDFAG